MPEPQALFTPENSQLAAMLHGDPNSVHYIGNEFGVQIVPGMQQLQLAVLSHGWKPGSKIEVRFATPIKLPSMVTYISSTSAAIFASQNDRTVFSVVTFLNGDELGAVKQGMFAQDYVLGNNSENSATLDELAEWDKDYAIPVKMLERTFPKNVDNVDLFPAVAAVGRSINAVVRALAANKGVLPDLYFPRVRDEGTNGVLEERLVLHMGDVRPELANFSLKVASPVNNHENKHGIIIRVDEASGIYAVDLYLTIIPKPMLEKMLRST